MKTALFFTLLACSLCLGSTAKKTKLNGGLSSIQTRKLQSGSEDDLEKKAKSAIDELSCRPYKKTDVNFIRPLVDPKKPGSKTKVTESECEAKCKKDSKCLAYNYNGATKECSFNFVLGDFDEKEDATTTLLRFEKNNPCDEANFIGGYHRTGGDYKSFHPKVPTAVGCCIECITDKSQNCVAWDYVANTNTCYLKKDAKELYAARHPDLAHFHYTGFGCRSSAV